MPLRQARLLHGLSLWGVYGAISIYSSRLSRLERGYTQPIPDVKEALALFFGLPSFILFPPDDEAEKEKRA